MSIFSIADRITTLYRGNACMEGSRADFKATADPMAQQFITSCAAGPFEL